MDTRAKRAVISPELAETRVLNGRPAAPGRLASVPLWVGRVLQLVALSLVVVAIPQLLLPEPVYWAASYLAIIGLSPEPFVFNAILLFVVGAAAKRRKRGALIFLILFELPNVITAVRELAQFFATRGPVALADRIQLHHDVIAGIIALAFIALLVVSRREFSARLEPATYRRTAVIVISGIIVAVCAGGILSLWFPGTLTSHSDGWLWSLNAAIGWYPDESLLTNDVGRPDTAVGVLVTTISAAALLIAVVTLLRTARSQRRLSASDELNVRRLLVETTTDDSLAYFATRRDKSVVFSPDRRAAISFRLVEGIALASGDPIGDERYWRAAAAEWLTRARSFGWIPAALSTTERGARLYESVGLQSTLIGDEAIIYTDRRSVARVQEHPDTRASTQRAQRAGYTTRIRRQEECSPVELAEIGELVDRWRAGSDERGFSMTLSRVGDPSDARSVIATAHDVTGRIMAVLIFVPWNRNGLSLDVMRRSPDAINGTTEFLVSVLLGEGAAMNVERISLNFAMFRETFVLGGRVGASRLLRAKRDVLLILSRWWQLDSLRVSNEKYSPEWRPRLMCWDRGVSRGRIALAAARAEGFLSLYRSPVSARRDPGESLRPSSFGQRAADLEHEFAARTSSVRIPSASTTARMLRGAQLARDGVDLYPATVTRTHSVSLVRSEFAHDPLAEGAGPVRAVAGRVMARRRHGRIAFVDVSEGHERLQLIASADVTAHYGRLLRVDLGDIVAAQGHMTRSRSGELSLVVETWELASKSLQPLPGKHTGLTDPETKLRLRHIDLATSPPAAAMITARSHATQALRGGLIDAGYLEVETPILNAIHGGANARPFRTHINAYDTSLTLRIAPELALKRLIVGGFPQVFEIGRNFRNEGADSTHNPEFTAVEAYRAFADYEDMRELAQTLIRSMATAIHGSAIAVMADGEQVNLSGEWPVVSVCDAISRAVGIPVSVEQGSEVLSEIARALSIPMASSESPGHIIEALYEQLVEKTTTVPTFYVDFPADTSPLTRPHRTIPGLAERWDLVAYGVELGTAYTELVDPIEQRRRLTEQSLRAAGGDPEAMEIDEAFLAALEFGMPPTGGLGLGVDRVVMFLTGGSIRQTLAFPFVRPEAPRRSRRS